jgi:hypothetical protein
MATDRNVAALPFFLSHWLRFGRGFSSLFGSFRGCRNVLWRPRRTLRIDVELDPKISTRPPAKVEINLGTSISHEWQTQELVLCDRKIPSAVWIADVLRIPSASHMRLVRDSNHVEGEIVKRISKTPLEDATFMLRPEPPRRFRSINISIPPDRINLVAGGDVRPFGCDLNRLPWGRQCRSRVGFRGRSGMIRNMRVRSPAARQDRHHRRQKGQLHHCDHGCMKAAGATWRQTETVLNHINTADARSRFP